MADQNYSSNKAASDTLDKVTVGAKTVADQAFSASRDLRDRALDMAGTSADAIREKSSDFVDAARDAAKVAAVQAGERIKQAVDDNKVYGADFVGSLAGAMNRAADEFDREMPIAGTYLRKAASHVENVSDQIKAGNVDDLISQTTAFARRQPTAFLGLAVLAGFGVVRFFKSSAEGSDEPDSNSRG